MNALIERLRDSSLIKHLHGAADISVNGLSADSRKITQNFLFFAVRGERADGNTFIPDAIKNGASVIVSENPCPETLSGNCAYVQVTDIHQSMAEISAGFYRTDHANLKYIGITGTNGKTTTASFIHRLLKAFSQKTVFIGTTGIEICGERLHSDYTTPPAYELHRFFRQGIDRGAQYVVMEVSSHALKYKRVWGLKFDAAVFTNLTLEHREIHPTMEDYFRTKLRLFSMLAPNGSALINADDPYGKKILETFDNHKNFFDYGYAATHARLMEIRSEDHTQTVRYRRGNADHVFTVPMIGEYNAYNALAAGETLRLLGFDGARTDALFKDASAPDGRLEWIRIQDFNVLIDFAHTPDGLEKLLDAVSKARKHGRLISIFGCPGSRDASKRPIMGEIASRLSDHVIVTTDDIHYEEPERIIADIVKGIKRNNFEVEVDRREAIRKGLQTARQGDWVVIAGRGHEKFQYVKDKRIPFLDKEIVVQEAEQLDLRVGKN